MLLSPGCLLLAAACCYRVRPTAPLGRFRRPGGNSSRSLASTPPICRPTASRSAEVEYRVPCEYRWLAMNVLRSVHVHVRRYGTMAISSSPKCTTRHLVRTQSGVNTRSTTALLRGRRPTSPFGGTQTRYARRYRSALHHPPAARANRQWSVGHETGTMACFNRSTMPVGSARRSYESSFGPPPNQAVRSSHLGSEKSRRRSCMAGMAALLHFWPDRA